MAEEATVLAATGAAVAVAMLVLWLLSLRLRNASSVDVYWGPGFVVVALVAFTIGDGYAPRRVLVLALVAVWGLRLGLHLGTRNAGKPEDFRYARMRERHGARFGRVSLVTVFGAQAVAMWAVSLPLQYAMMSGTPRRITWPDGIGAAVWAVGFAFEAIGDAQLRRFKADPANAGRVMDRGLWRYTRHPNYFGDATVWWGFFVIALNSPEGWWTVISPLSMTFVLAKITGVPMLERHMRRTKPGYEEYARRTSAMLPLPPKR